MTKPLHNPTTAKPKKAYRTPELKRVGSVKKLTLKTGSNTDGFGGFSA